MSIGKSLEITEKLAVSIASSQSGEAVDWLPLVESGLHKGLNEKGMLRLCRAGNHLMVVEAVLEFLSSLAGQHGAGAAWNELLTEVDDSDYSLEDWLLSIHALAAWLKQKRAAASGEDALAYIACAAEAGSIQPPGKCLRELTLDYLREFGMEASKPVLGKSAFS